MEVCNVPEGLFVSIWSLVSGLSEGSERAGYSHTHRVRPEETPITAHSRAGLYISLFTESHKPLNRFNPTIKRKKEVCYICTF